MNEPSAPEADLLTGPPRLVVPRASSESRPFWEATRERRYLVQWCTSCERAIHFPRAVCPSCLSDALEWRPSDGRGRVHAFSVQYVKGLAPYVVALVDLDDGIRVMSNVVGCRADQLVVGLPVQVGWEPLEDGRHLPVFAPA